MSVVVGVVNRLWDCVPRVYGGVGRCAGGSVPLAAVLALPGVGRSLGGILIIGLGLPL